MPPRTFGRSFVLAGSIALLAGVVAADEWLVFVGGGLEPIQGAWKERHGQVIYTQRNGTLVSVPYEEVDLATSAVITWQLSGRRQPPPRPELPEATPDAAPDPTCSAATIAQLSGSETMEIVAGDTRETIHIACLDAPEPDHRYPQLAWFGRATESVIELETARGSEICVTEQTPPQRDTEGHRIVYVKLASGRDYTAKVIASGLGLLRSGTCGRSAHYRGIENGAIAEGRGLWGTMSERPAMAAASLAVSISGSPSLTRSPSRRSGGG